MAKWHDNAWMRALNNELKKLFKKPRALQNQENDVCGVQTLVKGDTTLRQKRHHME